MLTYSGTFVNQQWPSNPQTPPGGSADLHEHLIPNSPARAAANLDGVGDRDPAQSPTLMRDTTKMVVANENTAKRRPPRAITTNSSSP